MENDIFCTAKCDEEEEDSSKTLSSKQSKGPKLVPSDITSILL